MEITNETLKTQLNHRSIRVFEKEPLAKEQLTAIYEAARHTSTSQFLQQFSILRITDEVKRKAISEIAKQDYVGGNGELLIFLADLNRNAKILGKRYRSSTDCRSLFSSSQ